MTGILTNQPEFLNEIAEEMRLFIACEEIERLDCLPIMDEGDTVLKLFLRTHEGVWYVDAECLQLQSGRVRMFNYEYSAPVRHETPLVEKRYRKRCVKIAAFRAMRGMFESYVPWGSLTGIRPTRLMRELISEHSIEQASRIMLEDFDVSSEKLELASNIVAAQLPIIGMQRKDDIDIYVGIPYCKTRCLYCSFASCVRTDKTDMRAYIDALKQDIKHGSEIVDRGGYRVRAVYVGGGTPTVLTADELRDVLEFTIDSYGGFGAELTVEAGRPDTIDLDKLRVIKDCGATRVSINPQTMCEKTLKLIGREHTPSEIFRAFNMARDAGISVINADVIAGLPGENEDNMKHTMDKMALLAPENLTVHTLALKRASRLKERIAEYPLPDAETADNMVKICAQAARDMDMYPYYMYRQKYMRGNLENVGYTIAGAECIYNIDMMEETTNIMAHGAGAMSKRIFDSQRRVERIPNPKDIDTYILKLNRTAGDKRALFLADRN